MLVGVISDTHRNEYMIRAAMSFLKDSDIIIHLGDNTEDVNQMSKLYKKRIIFVKGNCDMSTRIPHEIVETIEGKKFLITHGHMYDVKGGYQRLMYKALEIGADIALFGHTHAPEIIYEEGVWLINPGSAALSRRGPNSIAFIEIKDGKVNPSIKNLD